MYKTKDELGQYKLLIQHALKFFERSVLPTVEWMHYVLQQYLTPTVVNEGRLAYGVVCSVLPPLFSSELQGGVGA